MGEFSLSIPEWSEKTRQFHRKQVIPQFATQQQQPKQHISSIAMTPQISFKASAMKVGSNKGNSRQIETDPHTPNCGYPHSILDNNHNNNHVHNTAHVSVNYNYLGTGQHQARAQLRSMHSRSQHTGHMYNNNTNNASGSYSTILTSQNNSGSNNSGHNNGNLTRFNQFRSQLSHQNMPIYTNSRNGHNMSEMSYNSTGNSINNHGIKIFRAQDHSYCIPRSNNSSILNNGHKTFPFVSSDAHLNISNNFNNFSYDSPNSSTNNTPLCSSPEIMDTDDIDNTAAEEDGDTSDTPLVPSFNSQKVDMNAIFGIKNANNAKNSEINGKNDDIADITEQLRLQSFQLTHNNKNLQHDQNYQNMTENKGNNGNNGNIRNTNVFNSVSRAPQSFRPQQQQTTVSTCTNNNNIQIFARNANINAKNDTIIEKQARMQQLQSLQSFQSLQLTHNQLNNIEKNNQNRQNNQNIDKNWRNNQNNTENNDNTSVFGGKRAVARSVTNRAQSGGVNFVKPPKVKGYIVRTKNNETVIFSEHFLLRNSSDGRKNCAQLKGFSRETLTSIAKNWDQFISIKYKNTKKMSTAKLVPTMSKTKSGANMVNNCGVIIYTKRKKVYHVKTVFCWHRSLFHKKSKNIIAIKLNGGNNNGYTNDGEFVVKSQASDNEFKWCFKQILAIFYVPKKGSGRYLF